MTAELGRAVAYRERADQLRAEAVNARDPGTKRALTLIAENYVQLAKMIEDGASLPRGSAASSI